MDAARVWMAQAAGALAYMHAQGLVHGDVKPENLLLHRGQIKLCDFGLTCKDGTARHAPARGTRPYMAPELFRKSHVVRGAADVWSLGIVLYAMIFGALPWEMAVDTDPAYREYTRDGVIARVNCLSAALASLLRRMLEPSAATRAPMVDVARFFAQEQSWFSSRTGSPSGTLRA
eukprot:m.257780 g.257780  ORF g.257780 m.257780 type:complete len:175 (+) comp21041_c0_seq1:299-823(+)